MRNYDMIKYVLLLLSDILAGVYGLFCVYQFFDSGLIVDKMHYGFIVVFASLYFIYRTNGGNHNNNAPCV